jgi:hypothetical protein
MKRRECSWLLWGVVGAQLAFWGPRSLIEVVGVSYDGCAFEGVETKGFSLVDEEAMIAWQDVLDSVAAGRPGEVGCPFCSHRPLAIEEVEHSTRISCPKCKKFIQGRFQP